MAAFHRIERQAFEGMSTRSTEIERPIDCFALDSFTYLLQINYDFAEFSREGRRDIVGHVHGCPGVLAKV